MMISENDERWADVISVVERYTKCALEQDQRDDLRAAIGGAAAVYLASIHQVRATLTEQAKAMERIRKAARQIQAALSSLGLDAEHVALGLVSDGELGAGDNAYEERERQTNEFRGAISRIVANAPGQVSYVESRISGGPRGMACRNAFWTGLCTIWAGWYDGSIRPANGKGQPGGPAYKFITAVSKLVMSDDDCTAGKIHEFLKSNPVNFGGVLAE